LLLNSEITFMNLPGDEIIMSQSLRECEQVLFPPVALQTACDRFLIRA